MSLTDFEFGAVTTGAGTAIGAAITWLVARWYRAKDIRIRQGEAALMLALEFAALAVVVQGMPESATRVSAPDDQLRMMDHVLSPEVRLRSAIRLPEGLRTRVTELAGKYVLLSKAVDIARSRAREVRGPAAIGEFDPPTWQSSHAASPEFTGTYAAVTALRAEVLREGADLVKDLAALADRADVG